MLVEPPLDYLFPYPRRVILMAIGSPNCWANTTLNMVYMKMDSVKPKPLPFWQRTFSSLRYRDYCLAWLGSCTEHVGQYMESMAIAWLMKELTGSPYYQGLLAVC